MTTEITINSTDLELMAAYEENRRNANGEAAGLETDTPAQAAEREGWTVIRAITEGTNHPGCPVVATDLAGRVWVVNDIEGPWAIQVGDTDREITEKIGQGSHTHQR